MKKAFTLAEVLITLGIIGTIAALTMPALVKHTGAAEVGPKLSKFNSTVESAFKSLLHEEGVDKISDISHDADTIMRQLSHHMIMSPDMSGDTYTMYAGSYNADSDNFYIKNLDHHFVSNNWLLKDGSFIHYQLSEENQAINDKGSFKGIVGELYYDINGKNGTNIAGEEVFKFLVDNSGSLIPFGSNLDEYVTDEERPECSFDYVSLTEDEINEICEEAPDKCNANTTKETFARNFNSGFSCTGKIADNNWKTD